MKGYERNGHDAHHPWSLSGIKMDTDEMAASFSTSSTAGVVSGLLNTASVSMKSTHGCSSSTSGRIWRGTARRRRMSIVFGVVRVGD